jgi:DNA-binding NarL/FixJ family response regulator
MPWRVIIADDHPVFRDGLAALLESSDEVELVGQASSGGEAVELVKAVSPDVIVMDLKMPGMNGIEAVHNIRAIDSHVGIIALTMFDDDESVYAAMRAGVLGYLLKEADAATVLHAIRAVACGEGIFSPGVAQRVVSHFTGASRESLPFPVLTAGERAVLDLIAAGHNNGAIATLLGLSHKTIRNRVSSILSKLHLADRSDAIIKARAAGLGQAGKKP